MARSESIATYREPAPTQRKSNPFLGIAKRAREEREAIDALLATTIDELNEAIAEDLGQIAIVTINGFDITIQSRKTGQSTSLALPILLGFQGYRLEGESLNPSRLHAYLRNQLTCGKLLDVLVKIKRGA